MNTERRNPTDQEKKFAWENVAGKHPTHNIVFSPVYCPYKNCVYKDSPMHWKNYGNYTNISWVVDHKVPLNKGGTWDKNNLQAMHNYCNNIKGNS